MDALEQTILALLERVAAEVILPRFGRLSAADTVEKTPGDWVTIADRESEAIITDELLRLDPHARVVSEEAASADPSLIDTVANGRVWLVDPLDGTNNFAEGREPFGMMVALVEDGVTQAGWIYAPVTKRLCSARRGAGAFIDGVRVTVAPLTDRVPVATYSNYWFSPEEAAAMRPRPPACSTCVTAYAARRRNMPRWSTARTTSRGSSASTHGITPRDRCS